MPPQRFKASGKKAQGDARNAIWNLSAARPNQIWSYDFMGTHLRDGTPVRILNVVDEFTREALVSRVDRTIGALAVMDELTKLFAKRGRPEMLRSDNGREFIASSLVEWLNRLGVSAVFVEKGSPQPPLQRDRLAAGRDAIARRTLWPAGLPERSAAPFRMGLQGSRVPGRPPLLASGSRLQNHRDRDRLRHPDRRLQVGPVAERPRHPEKAVSPALGDQDQGRLMSQEGANSGPKRSAPVSAWGISGLARERVLTWGAGVLARTVRPIWYSETLVLSARYLQLLEAAPWASGGKRYRHRVELWEKAALPRLREASFTTLEFGVAGGRATKWWNATGVPFAAWHGFDTFEGLPVAWKRGDITVMAAGEFTPAGGAGAVPNLEADFLYSWHRGLIEDTLPPFDRPDTSLFVLIDVDLLAPAADVLEWLLAKGKPGDIVYFDEAFDPWDEGLAIRNALAAGLKIRALGYTGSALLIELL